MLFQTSGPQGGSQADRVGSEWGQGTSMGSAELVGADIGALEETTQAQSLRQTHTEVS